MSIERSWKVDACGCCRVPVSPTPEEIWNRPGLPTIRYRVGTYSSFRRAMIERIPSVEVEADGSRFRPLRGWTTRTSDDYGIALLEMWAYLADILTFYQERAANEAFLRTALFRESVLRLAALLDYEPAPGVAATTHLAFTLERDKQLQIPIGLRVQSVPGQDEKPQKFETVEAIEAATQLNRVRIFPQPQAHNPLVQGSSEGVLLSTPEELAPDQSLLVFDATRIELKQVTDLVEGDHQTLLSWTPPIQSTGFGLFTSEVTAYDRRFRLFGYNAPESYLEAEPTDVVPGGVRWSTKHPDFKLSPGNKFKLDARYDDLKPGSRLLLAQAAPSVDAPSGFTRTASIKTVDSQGETFGPLRDTVTEVTLDMAMTATPAVVRDSGGSLRVFTIGDDGALWHIRQLTPGGAWSSWSSLGGRIDMLTVSQNKDGRLEVFARGTNKGLWHIWQIASGGWSEWASLGGQIDMLTVGQNKDGRLEVFARGTDGALWHVWQLSPGGAWSSWSSLGGRIDMLAVGQNKDGRLEVFARGTDRALWHIWQTSPNNGWSGWASRGGQIDMLSVGQNKDGRLEVFIRGTNHALWHIWQTSPNDGWSGWASRGGQIDMLAVGQNKDGRLEVFVRGMDKGLWHIWQTSPNNGWSGWASLAVPMWTVSDLRQVVVFELTRPSLRFWDRRYPDTIAGNTVYVPLSQLRSLEPEHALMLGDDRVGPRMVRVVEASPDGIDHPGGSHYLKVTFTPALASSLDTRTAVLYGNVALATHGETVAREVLGNGDASTAFQSFGVRKSPVTFVPHPGAPHGAANTLQVRVGGVLWREVRNFYGYGDDDRIYTTSVDNEEKMTVRFGDGKTGARLPTGRDNVVAAYREGFGEIGNVRARSLSTLLDRPVGLKSVTNPAEAQGGADPETLQEARTNAPNTVRTFGRIVSLRDFEDAAREFASVAKARATWIWDGEEQAVHLTVAGHGGVAITGETYENLVEDLDRRRDPNRKLVVPPGYRKVPVQVEATIQVHPDYQIEEVQATARRALEGAFAFDHLEFGQSIHLSDVYRVLQDVTGVVAVVISLLRFKEATDRTNRQPTSAPVQAHLRIDPGELACIDQAVTDAVVDAGVARP